jgi:hypothetical protein
MVCDECWDIAETQLSIEVIQEKLATASPGIWIGIVCRIVDKIGTS